MFGEVQVEESLVNYRNGQSEGGVSKCDESKVECVSPCRSSRNEGDGDLTIPNSVLS
jgi:hypothetical protein